MISYLDVLTILLIFFVAVAAKSLETTEAGGGFQGHAGHQRRYRLSCPTRRRGPSRKEIQKKLEQYGLEWHAEPRGLVITLPQAILFAQGKAKVNAAALPMIDRIADVLQRRPE